MKRVFRIAIGVIIGWVVLYANLPSVFYKLGKNFYENKNYISAQKYLNAALAIKPDNPDYRYYYVQTLINMPASYDNQRLIFYFASSENDDSAKMIANEKLSEWKSKIRAKYGDTYIEQAPMDSRILRWDKNSFPLKVYVDQNGIEIPDYYKSAVMSAFSQWDKSVDFIGFENSANAQNAQILIQFKPLPKDVCSGNVCKYVVGYTSPTIKGDTLKKMTIIIYDKNPSGKYFSDKEVYNTVLHELGHALGIMGHSYSTDDLMYQNAKEQSSVWAKFRSEFQYVTGHDVNTIKLLYALDPDITNMRAENQKDLFYPPIILGSATDIANKKLKETLDYVAKSPHIAVGYINLAGAYSELKEYNKAIDALNKAQDLATSDDERYIVYYNLASVYFNLGHNNTALQYAELAKKVKQTEEILELISIIKVRK